jgi:hypothetical protein
MKGNEKYRTKGVRKARNDDRVRYLYAAVAKGMPHCDQVSLVAALCAR